MDSNLIRLKEIGFTVVGCWKLGKDGIYHELHTFADASRVLYAFAVDDELVYIGKTTRPLRTRLAGYRNPAATQSTNIKNNRNIQNNLAAGKRVDVYVLPDNGLLHYGSFHLNTAAGLEDSLINELNPKWNGGKKEGPDQSFQPIVQPFVTPPDRKETTISQRSKTTIAEQFRVTLSIIFAEASQVGQPYIDVNAGLLHRKVGGYPGTNHRMPVCCSVLRAAMQSSDQILAAPPKGNGASLIIRFVIPRQSL